LVIHIGFYIKRTVMEDVVILLGKRNENLRLFKI